MILSLPTKCQILDFFLKQGEEVKMYRFKKVDTILTIICKTYQKIIKKSRKEKIQKDGHQKYWHCFFFTQYRHCLLN
jgi:hypothetical protein